MYYPIMTELPTVCPADATHEINPDSMALIDNLSLGKTCFGDGSDGSATLSANTTLSRNMYYVNLTIPSGVVVTTNGFGIYVLDTLYLSGTISASGGNASGRTAGISYTAQILGSGSAGGTGGAAGAAGVAGLTLTSGTRCGGLGGSGGSGAAAAGVAGSGTVIPEANGGQRILFTLSHALRCRDLNNVRLNGGSGGGGGGGGTSTTGGGGGSGGGMVLLMARYISGNGNVIATGGNGGNAIGTGNGGGGGGGGGGVILLGTLTDLQTITVNVNGGIGGTRTGTGANGANGSIGNIYYLRV